MHGAPPPYGGKGPGRSGPPPPPQGSQGKGLKGAIPGKGTAKGKRAEAWLSEMPDDFNHPPAPVPKRRTPGTGRAAANFLQSAFCVMLASQVKRRRPRRRPRRRRANFAQHEPQAKPPRGWTRPIFTPSRCSTSRTEFSEVFTSDIPQLSTGTEDATQDLLYQLDRRQYNNAVLTSLENTDMTVPWQGYKIDFSGLSTASCLPPA